MDKSIITKQRLYLTSNENPKQIFENLKIKPKKVLTTGSSWDQVFNAIFYGATDITLFDISVFAKPFGELKKYAFLNLNLEEHKKFLYDLPTFIQNNPEFYNNANQSMTKESRECWDYLLKPENIDVLKKVIDVDIDLEGSRFYENEENYSKLQTILKQSNFKVKVINENLVDLPKYLDKEYELVLLSNIDDYFIDTTNKNKIYDFIKAASEIYSEHLKAGGVMQLTSSMNKFNTGKTKFYNSVCPDTFANGKFFTIENSGIYSTNGSSNVSFFVKKQEKILEETNDNE